MIYVNIRGNLGNQLFEYCFARKLQAIINQKICLNVYNFYKVNSFTHEHNKFDLKNYKLNNDVYIEENKRLPKFVDPEIFVNKVLRNINPEEYFKFMQKNGCYCWLNESYRDDVKFAKKENYYIDGYWQSEKYFYDIKETIKRELIPKNEKCKKNEKLYNLMKNKNSVCISIRRGDYVTNEKFKKIFYLCDRKYFEKGISLMEELVENPTWFVFSDDIEWVKENYKFNGEAYYEDGTDPTYEKLRLMSSCKHFIISNSSFSWWSQYLSNNEQKVVIAPSKWYNDGRETGIYQERMEFNRSIIRGRNMKTLVGIVLYNPDLNRLNENIKKIEKQVDEVLYINNNSQNTKKIEEIINKKNKENTVKHTLINNNENLGIAYALNQILNYAYENNYQWFLTLDQDSVCNSNLIKEYLKYINLPNIAMITCNKEDRNFKNLEKVTMQEYEEVDSCITSSCFNKTSALKEVGGFDNYFFIDYVDFDICYSLKEKRIQNNKNKIFRNDSRGRTR